MSLELPFPPSDLNPNRSRRLHWAKRSRAASEYRRTVWGTAMADWKGGTIEPPAHISVTFVVKDRRKRDMDNLIAAFKPGLDGLVDAKVVLYDDHDRLKVTYGMALDNKAYVLVKADSKKPNPTLTSPLWPHAPIG